MDTMEELHNNYPTPFKNIHDLLKNGDVLMEYSPDKDIVLLLGNTGSGKSTLTLYISGNADRLLSQEVEEDTGQYVIVDKENKISSNSTIVSQTIYPDLVEDAKTKTLYYDCPGFSDTRSAAHEISATYFIKKVIDSARSVKMVFVVSHNAVTKGEDRQDFILMLQHATTFIKHIEKFKDSIALVVTKVENRYVRNEIVSDEKVIKAIGHYLEQAKWDFEQYPEMVSSDSKEKVLSLLDIFLSRVRDEEYLRIGVLRKPNEPGPISDIELMKECKISLENLINKNIKFVKLSDEDFGYTVSAKSKVYISGLVEEITKTILKEIIDMGKEIREYCISLEERNSELEYLITKFQTLQESFSNLQDSAINDTIIPEQFISEIENNIKYFKINISDYFIKTIHREGDYIKFLNLMSNESVKGYKASLLAAGLSELVEYLSDSQSFYILVDNLYRRLSEFDFQKNRNKYQAINVQELNDLIGSPIFKKIEHIFNEHSAIRNIKLCDPKLKLLNRVLDETLSSQLDVTRPETDKIVVKGIYIKLSELEELISNENIKFLEIFAQYKVFIDSSLDLTGREIQMAIVAPVWEVIGNQSIILDGKPGMDHNPQKAKSGMEYGESGCVGLCGEPGGPAGNFIGIGKHYINEGYLNISANGGKGGRGQDGGDGGDGYDGTHEHATKKERCTIIGVVFNNVDQEYPGGKGGNGGDGGSGGYGGHKGFINIIQIGTEYGMVQAKQSATDGVPGRDGEGGGGGKGGRCYCFTLTHVLITAKRSFDAMDKWAEDGIPGCLSSINKKDTWQLTKLINLNDTITEYKRYLQSNIKNNLLETFLTTFLSEVDNYHIPNTQARIVEEEETDTEWIFL